MLVLGSQIISTPVMSLQTGARLANIATPVIDPRDLSIAAYFVADRFSKQPSRLLRTADVRDYSSIGFIIDSVDEFIEPEDVINIKKLIDVNFELIGILVVDEDKQKLGKVEDYSVNPDNFIIEQLVVKRSIVKSLGDTGLLINRKQIVEINDDKIIVKSTKVKKEEKVKFERQPFINPFATVNPQPDTSELSNSANLPLESE